MWGRVEHLLRTLNVCLQLKLNKSNNLIGAGLAFEKVSTYLHATREHCGFGICGKVSQTLGKALNNLGDALLKYFFIIFMPF